MNGRRWTDEEKARLLAMDKSGYRDAVIASDLGRMPGQVTDMRRKLKLKQERRRDSRDPAALDGDAAAHGHRDAIAAARARRDALADVPRSIDDVINGTPEPGRSAWDQLSPEQRRAAL